MLYINTSVQANFILLLHKFPVSFRSHVFHVSVLLLTSTLVCKSQYIWHNHRHQVSLSLPISPCSCESAAGCRTKRVKVGGQRQAGCWVTCWGDPPSVLSSREMSELPTGLGVTPLIRVAKKQEVTVKTVNGRLDAQGEFSHLPVGSWQLLQTREIVTHLQ